MLHRVRSACIAMDPMLSIDESPTQLTVLNHFVETTLLNGVPVTDYSLIEQIAFADGTVWNKAAIAQRAIVPGRPLPWSAALGMTPLWSIIRSIP